MASYSAFFSSGLLAPYQAYTSATASSFDMSPIRPASPLPGADIERSSTPTPSSHRNSSDLPLIDEDAAMPSTTHSPQSSAAPRLRRRRSSLTVGMSPMNTIKSPQRNAGAAMRFAHHSISISSPSRSRSGSIGAGNGSSMGGIAADLFGVASQGTSLVGRMRSGSVGGALRPRRALRRGLTNFVPAAAPPPSAPLPPLPLLPFNANFNNSRPQQATPSSCLLEAPVIRSRDRAYSIDANTIDEEMKEN
ncbi:hypothetical protein CCMSSC00406_0004768 [Pleurotus cornucopiae]|uniref:Uncharacterized protein n=1 Tax=Pleurotus cornucopiae TaxID=5321 RepID=A0ACB7J2M3_PLECO|nr:hypothetical protein CCMSSC00406_0004768 [Pleurotus cornucopiae]